jgi:cation:H+ antiporter
MLYQVLFLVLGFVLLIKGADWLVNGASALAKRYNISDLAVGLTIVAFGTSAPEMVVNVFASIQNHENIIFGNVIGSNNINLFVILGITGLITPIVVKSNTVWREIPFSFFSIILLFVISNDLLFSENCILSRIDGLILLALFVLFLLYVYKQLKKDTPELESSLKEYTLIKIWLLIVIGLIGLIAGGRLVVYNAVKISITLGVSEKVIGLTIVAIGTSLPELATSVVAAVRKNIDIAVGNIIGSNIFNIFLILAVSSIIKPIKYDVSFNFDLFLLAAGTIFLFVTMFTGVKKRLDRWEAGILFIVYIGYLIYMISNL